MAVRFSFTAIFFLALSVAYLAAEFAFNADMLDVAGSVRTPPTEIDRVKDYGRAISGAGFTLLVMGLFARRGFRVIGWEAWAMLSAVLSICLIPFFTVVFGGNDIEVSDETFLALLPVLGFFLIASSGGRYPIYVIISLVLMAWPAMYCGQKIMIDQYLVGTTDWQTRAEARNVLMLRSGLETCTIDLGDKWLCEQGSADAEVRAVRAMITSLWMHNPSAVIADLGDYREKIIEDMARQGTWFSPSEMYAKYRSKAEDEYSKIDGERKKTFKAYKQASDAYRASVDNALLTRQAEVFWRMASARVEGDVDRGWEEYTSAVRQFREAEHNALYQAGKARREALRKVYADMSRASRVYDWLCENRNCRQAERIENIAHEKMAFPDVAAELESAKEKGRIAFIKASGGYSPDIVRREDFRRHPETLMRINDGIRRVVAARTGNPDYSLPKDFIFDHTQVMYLYKGEAQKYALRQWNRNFAGKIPAGLDEAAFYKHAGVDGLPALEDLVLSEDEFIEHHLIPNNRKMADEMIAEMEKEAPFYANGELLEQKGKNYVRAAQIPAVALLISLVIVLLTIVRGIYAGLLIATHFVPIAERGRLLAMTGVMMMIIFMPYMISNRHTDNDLYRRYLSMARSENLFTATIIDWAIHMQPVIYKPGSFAKEKLGLKGG